ncbi:50S ribosome-binding GTPase [Fragilaria crotonensis]|nr:50S ribosome-binding GTPase [Fragilaria crotonensis]
MRQQAQLLRSRTLRRRKLLVLHGSRQVGQLLLGRVERLRKKLLKAYNIEMVAIDGPFPHPDDESMRQWWIRNENECQGLDQTLELVQSTWNYNTELDGILGFSQGARLAHLLVQCHESKTHPLHLEGLRYVLMFAGYEAPIPTNLRGVPAEAKLETPSMHIYGLKDKIITLSQSKDVMKHYLTAIGHEHDSGHHVPMQAPHVEAYLKFIEASIAQEKTDNVATSTPRQINAPPPEPDEDALLAQQDEVEALSAIFPDEFQLLSQKTGDTYATPISYQIDLPPSNEGVWPPHSLALRIVCPHNYPTDTMACIEFVHGNNMMEFSSAHVDACLKAMRDAAEAELGMPSVLTCVYAARDFFESGGMTQVHQTLESADDEDIEFQQVPANPVGTVIKPASQERIKECNLQGLEIARKLLLSSKPAACASASTPSTNSHGGTWKYTCGLVGKPSAGKSTFFNAATAFARQRNDADNAMGGATMAPHPFTTIDPNFGFCLVPAPPGSCPEESTTDDSIGCTHGRDHLGRRLIPVMLKDVAGLVPGAYQGRGRGNKFLNDLTDADVLIHVVDASGTADTEGNAVGSNEDGGSHPLNDLAWILNELIEWVFNNVVYKWDSIRRRGRNKLSDMFSGYGQSQAVLFNVIAAVEKFMQETEQRDRALDRLHEWDEGDLHRLVSAFLGVRFPMALALNKSDLPSAKQFIQEVEDALPIHGAHVGIPLSARTEMTFVKQHILQQNLQSNSALPNGVWQCLQSAMSLREPVLVFPVSDLTTYSPLPGMTRVAIEDASLPSPGMVACLLAAGGSSPTLWKDGSYIASSAQVKLRDVLVMKPGSTVEDVFLSLKRLGALGGEFVRAEGAGNLGEKGKLVPKHEVITRSNRILKIMTNKRREWQT